MDDHLQNKGFCNYHLIEGNILETLPKFLEDNPALKISLLHVDVDVYEPTKIILKNLWDRIVIGGILMLDDYGTVAGETQAVDEFFDNQKLKGIEIYKTKYNYIPSYIIKK